MKYLYILTVLLLASNLSAQTVSSVLYADGFEILVDIDFDDSGIMYVVEKRGRIQLVSPDGTTATEPLLDIVSKVNSAANERGLLGMTLHPDWENNGFLYVHYTKSDGTSVIARFTKGIENTIDPETEDIILEVDQPFSNHNAGALHFGPDGYLYIGMGDGGNAGDPGNRSQNPLLHLGKMLRLDVSGVSGYSIPDDNPFVNAVDTLPEIWAMGVRNPWKFSFDLVTGDMYIADVGQNKWEEIDFQPAASTGGENYGWRCFEGFETFNSNGCGDDSLYTLPIHVYENDEVNVGCSVTGGYVYRGDSISYLSGRYIYGDYCTGRIWALGESDCGDWLNEEILEVQPNELSTFGQDHEGNIYYGLIGDGTIHKLTKLCTLDASLSAIDPICPGQASGSIDIQVEGAADSFDIEITGGAYTNLLAGQYTAIITDAEQCQAILCTTLLDPEAFDYPELEPQLITVCEGDTAIIDFNMFFNEFPDLMLMLYLNSELIDSNWNGELTVLSTGEYTVRFTKDGCSSASQVLVQIFSSPAGTIAISLENDMLSASTGFAAYQWYANGLILIGETDRVLSNFELGIDYLVEGYTINGCLATSELFSIVNTKEEWLADVTISPNPTSNFINVTGNIITQSDVTITLSTIDGRHILYTTTANTSRLNLQIGTTELGHGTYLLTISDGVQSMSKKILKY